MSTKRQWRKPIESDKARKCRARNEFEKKPFYVEWNAEYQTWAVSGSPHILVRVYEILDAKEAP